jgi:DNA polymerase III epsilon subunit-like protein
MVKILAFDTETTSLTPVSSSKDLSYSLKREIDSLLGDTIKENLQIVYKHWDNWLHLWPHITQLSYIFYDTEDSQVVTIGDKYIRLDEGVEISAESSAITHIYKSVEDAREKGVKTKVFGKDIHILDKQKNLVTIKEALEEFMTCFNKCDYVVGHNVDFDKKMLLAELRRIELKDEALIDESLNHFKTILWSSKFKCTMMNNINTCKLEKISKIGNTYFKYPSLLETYKHFFSKLGSIDETKLHNSLIDVVMCLRIFCKELDIDVYGTNKEITKLLDTIVKPVVKQYNTRSKSNSIA